jgi:hypothetical protein
MDLSNDVILSLIVITCYAKGSPRVEGDEDEEDVDDIEYEFKMEEEKYKLKHEENMRSRDDDDDDYDENTKYGELHLSSHSMLGKTIRLINK